MEHAEALERIEIAAAEPDGLARLTAGDTPDGAAVAGHLAGCPACVAELARIARTSSIVREIIGSEPDPALRERTLAFVRAVGRDRSGAPAAAVPPEPARVPGTAAPAPSSLGARRRTRLAWVAGLAAAVVIAGTLGFAAGGASRDQGLGGKDAEIRVLQLTAATTLRVSEQPDARRIALAPTTGGSGAAGTLLFSPRTGELVVVATGLAWEAAGQEYGCWVEVNGQRRRLGKMYWGGDLATWAGSAYGLSSLPAGTTFGVSLGPVGGGDGATPVLTGRL